jgi:hypothetical protein
MATNNDTGFTGQLKPPMAGSDIDALTFAIQQFLNRVHTATLVKVLACTNAGDVSPVGRVDVLPQVNQLDGALQAMPHAAIYDVPYLRVQGGADAVIIDPKPGDIGVALFAERDISAVKSSKQQSNPGSGRMMDIADALYLGGMLNGVPQQYLRYYAGGIEVVSPTKIRLAAPQIEIAAGSSISVTSPSGDVVVKGISLVTHVHGGVTPGGATTAGPQ